MKAKPRKKNKPDIIYKNGRPSAVIIDIADYQEMLELIEDADDLKYIAEMKKKPLKIRDFDDFLKEHSGRA